MARHPSRDYRRREPEKSVLYEAIRRHFETFEATVEAGGHALPAFIRREFEKYLRCGILAHGFVRCRCAACGHNRLVAFSCKCRGWCPSCIGRRMADTAAYLVDHVIPDIPLRTWTLTFPQPLRYLLAYDSALLNEVIGAYSVTLFRWIRRRAKTELGLESIENIEPGMITWIQRFGSAANLNLHLHSAVTEGVYVKAITGELEWHTISAPASWDVAEIAWDTCKRISALVRARGLESMADGDLDALAAREPLLAACYSGSINGFVATGRRAGQPMMQMGVPVADHGETRPAVPAHGFNLFAGRRIGAHDRARREHAIRYMARPPIVEDRLSFAANGDVLLKLKRPWATGTTHARFTGHEFIERLVSLVPPPKVNMVRYRGVFAPNARSRPRVVERARADSGASAIPERRKKTGRYLDWAELMRRVFEIDVTRCPKCGVTGMQVIATIIRRAVIHDILASIGEPTGPPVLDPASFTDQGELDFFAA